MQSIVDIGNSFEKIMLCSVKDSNECTQLHVLYTYASVNLATLLYQPVVFLSLHKSGVALVLKFRFKIKIRNDTMFINTMPSLNL